MSLQEWYEGATEEDLACEDFLNGAVVPWADLASLGSPCRAPPTP